MKQFGVNAFFSQTKNKTKSTQEILYLLRCSPCQGHPLLSEMDALFRLYIGLCHIANFNLTEMQWTQASLPCRNGGLGVRRASSLALPASLASSCSTRRLQDCILMCTAASNSHYFEQYVTLWSSNFSCSVPLDADAHSQCNWDKPIVDAEFANLLLISNTLMTERVFLLCRHVTAVIAYTQCQSPRVVFGSKMKTFVWPLGFGSAPHFASHVNVLAVLWSLLLAYTVCRAKWVPANMHGTKSLMIWSHALSLLQTFHVLKNLRVYLEVTESDWIEWHSSHGRLGNALWDVTIIDTVVQSYMSQ